MLTPKFPYNASDAEAGKILNDFLPNRIFDAHAHLLETALMPNYDGGESLQFGWERYKEEMSLLMCNRQLQINALAFPHGEMADRSNGLISRTDAFIIGELNKCPGNVGELIVHPADTEQELEARLTHPGLRGFKCYHNISGAENTWDATIDQYLPESAWAVAHRHKLVITLHMVRDHALADEKNLSYIRTQAKKYPDAVLILAHCARAFASWTGVESVAKLSDLDNVWFDFSAVCESPAMLQIIKKAGIKRCLWGSDYPVCRYRGKAISLADSFYWILQKDLDNFSSLTRMNSYLVGTENLMAVRQAFILAELGDDAVEDFFWNNAQRLFSR